jgi:hypothetical protein
VCEFLIRSVNNTNPDSIKDKAGCYKANDIVEVRHNGGCGTPAPGSKMYVIKAPDLDFESSKHYMDSDVEITYIPVDGEPTKEIRTTKTRRKYSFDLNSLPEKLRTTIRDKKIITITLEQVKMILKAS